MAELPNTMASEPDGGLVQGIRGRWHGGAPSVGVGAADRLAATGLRVSVEACATTWLTESEGVSSADGDETSSALNRLDLGSVEVSGTIIASHKMNDRQ